MNKSACIAALMFTCLIFVSVSCSYAYQAQFQHSYSGPAANSGVTDETTGAWLAVGCSVEVMYVGSNGQYDPPGTGDDEMLGVGKTATALAKFYFPVEVTAGQQVYVRVWNGQTESSATFYGTSEITTVPAEPIPLSSYPGYGYDVGPGAVWTYTGGPSMGLDQPAVHVYTPTPFSLPTITAITPSPAHLGMLITIEGSNFGAGVSGDHVSVEGVTVDIGTCLTWESDRIVLTIEAEMAAGVNVPVIVLAGGSDSGTDNTLDIQPWIVSVNPSTGLIGGVTKVQLTGGGFGASRGSNFARFNAVIPPTSNYSLWGSTEVEVLVPTGSIDGYITLEVNSMTSNAAAFTMETPVAVDITPSSGNLGDVTNITGESFGTVEAGARSTAANALVFNGTDLPDGNIPGSSAWQTNAITFSVPQWVTVAGPLNVAVRAGGHLSGTVQYTVTPEVSSSTNPVSLGAPVITVEGTAFGSSKGSSSVEVTVGGNTYQISVTHWSTREITGTLPGSIVAGAGSLKVFIDNGGVVYPSNAISLTITALAIPRIITLNPASRAVGQTMVITGESFGTDPGAGSRDTPTNHILIGGVTVPTAQVFSWSNTQIICEIPSGAPVGSGISVEVTKGGIPSLPNYDLTITGGVTPGVAHISISKVKINGRTYITGEVVNATPVITALITPDPGYTLDFNYSDVTIDYVPLPAGDVTCEAVPGVPGTYLMTATVKHPIAAGPVRGHRLELSARNVGEPEKSWEGSLAVMSGAVQVLGSVLNYPNPFKPLSSRTVESTTKIAYNLSVDANIYIIIYDITGHEVHRGYYSSGTEGGHAGINQVTWSGRDLFNGVVPNGMFIYKIISGDRVIGTGKLVVYD